MYEHWYNLLSPGLRTTFVLSKAQLGEFDPANDNAALKHHVNLALFARGAEAAGTVHTWEYANGDMRFTYQPHGA